MGLDEKIPLILAFAIPLSACGSKAVLTSSEAFSQDGSGSRSSPGTDAPEPQPGDVIILRDDFDAYQGVVSSDPSPRLTSSGWIINTADSWPKLIAGRGAGGKALRFSYTPSNGDTEVETWFNPTQEIFVRYWYRTSPGADPTYGGQSTSGFKWFMVWREDNAPRYTMGVGRLNGGPAGYQNSGLEFSTHDNSSPQMPDPFMQNIDKSRKFGTTNDGNWHRYTLQVRTGAGGFERTWVDGTLVLDSSVGAPGVPSGGYAHSSSLINMVRFTGNVVDGVPSSIWSFDIDIDDFVIWRKP
jgi:hypothetical protein